MNAEPDLPRLVARLATWVALLTLLAGVSVLASWAFDITLLKSISPNWVSMKANTAVCFVLSGIALFLALAPPASATPRQRIGLSRLGRACGGLSGLIAALTLSEYIFAWNSGIDQWLFLDAVGAAGTSHPGRMAPETAVCFVLLFLALLFYTSGKSGWRMWAIAGLPALVETLALLSLSSYLLPGSSSLGWLGLTAMAVHTATLFALLGASLLAGAWGRFRAVWQIKEKLTFASLAVLFFSLWFLTFYGGRLLQQDLVRHLGEQQFSAVSLVANELENEVAGRLQALEINATKITPAILGNAAALQSFLEARPVFTHLFSGGVWVARDDGIAIAAVPSASGRIGMNFMDREYLIAVLKGGGSTVSKPSRGSASGFPSFVMATPIRDPKGKVTGALVGVNDLNKPNFLDAISNARYGNTGDYLLAVVKQRLIVTASEKTRIMTSLPAPGSLPALDHYLQGGEGPAVYVNSRGVEVLASAKHIPVAGWVLAVTLPTQEAFAPIYHVQVRMLIAAVLLTLLASGLIWWQLRRQLGPLISTAEILAATPPDERLLQPLPIAAGDEIGTLISSFNRLLATLGEREKTLRESELRSRSITQTAHEAIITTDSAGNIVSWNHGAEIIFGYAEIEAMGQPMTLLIPERYREGHLAGMQRMRSGAAARILGKTVELHGMRKDGNEFPLELSLAKWASGEGWFVTGIISDISARKQAAAALQAAAEQFRGLVEQSIAGIYIVQDGKFAYANPRFAEIRGYQSADELIGCDALALAAEKDRAMIVENNRLLLSGEVRNMGYAFTALRKDGSTTEVGTHAAYATYQGRPAVIGLMQDISEKIRAEENIRRYVAQLETAFKSTVQVATNLSEMRDPYTTGHSRRVAEIATALSAELGFDAQRQEGMRVAGYLHDIGKISVPSEILAKPGRLEPIEFDLVKEHAQGGYDILKGVEFPWPVAEVARQHHERIDGSGYPQGLKGGEILLEARILAVADVVEAMSSDRPYRPGLGIDSALAEIERGRGSAYDPGVADACLKLFRERGYTIPA